MKKLNIKIEKQEIKAKPRKLKASYPPKKGPDFLNPDDFITHHMVPYPDMVRAIGWTSIEVLSFLKGRKWDEVALGYVHALRPSSIRVTEGLCTMDARSWRVTVYIYPDKQIKKIEQEVEVSLPEGVNCGWAMNDALKYGIDSPQVAWHRLEGDGIICMGGETFTMVNGEKVVYPKAEKDPEREFSRCGSCGNEGSWKLDTTIQKIRLCDECLKTEDEFWRDYCHHAETGD